MPRTILLFVWADLTLAIAGINAWNRLSIAARLTPGTYQPASAGA